MPVKSIAGDSKLLRAVGICEDTLWAHRPTVHRCILQAPAIKGMIGRRGGIHPIECMVLLPAPLSTGVPGGWRGRLIQVGPPPAWPENEASKAPAQQHWVQGGCMTR